MEEYWEEYLDDMGCPEINEDESMDEIILKESIDDEEQDD